MKKIAILLVVCLCMFSNAKAQDSFSNEYYFPFTVATDASIGVFATQVEDFIVNTQPMINVAALWGVNPNLFAGLGVGFGKWNYDDNDGYAKVENQYFSVPVYATARYVFGSAKKSGLFFDAKIGYRLGNKITIDMLSDLRVGQNDRIINGCGLYSGFSMGILVRKFELVMGINLQNVEYDIVDQSEVISSGRIYNINEHKSDMMRSFVVQLGYWF